MVNVTKLEVGNTENGRWKFLRKWCFYELNGTIGYIIPYGCCSIVRILKPLDKFLNNMFTPVHRRLQVFCVSKDCRPNLDS